MDYDSIVVGAGIIGSFTAYHLAKSGHNTLLLEQFSLPHDRGSSHGQSRIIRKAYGKYEHFTEMMKEAYELWETIEKESKSQLYRKYQHRRTKLFENLANFQPITLQTLLFGAPSLSDDVINATFTYIKDSKRKTGMLAVGEKDNVFLVNSRIYMQKDRMPYVDLNHKSLRRKYPMLRFPQNYEGLLDEEAGVLFAGKAVTVVQEEFKKYGGVLQDLEPLVEVIPGNVVTAVTNKGRYRARNIVLTVGPWASQVLSPLGLSIPLTTIRISVCYWKEKNPGEHNDRDFPTFYEENGVDGRYHIYALPSVEYPGHVKICLHTGPEIDPNKRDDVDGEWVMSRVTEYVKKHFINVESKPSIVEYCIYTLTPDYNFVLDHHPHRKNIIIGVGLSGHGFKLAPVVGKVLSQLATNQTPKYNMKHFSLQRFPLNKL